MAYECYGRNGTAGLGFLTDLFQFGTQFLQQREAGKAAESQAKAAQAQAAAARFAAQAQAAQAQAEAERGSRMQKTLVIGGAVALLGIGALVLLRRRKNPGRRRRSRRRR